MSRIGVLGGTNKQHRLILELSGCPPSDVVFFTTSQTRVRAGVGGCSSIIVLARHTSHSCQEIAALGCARLVICRGGVGHAAAILREEVKRAEQLHKCPQVKSVKE